MSTDNDEEEEGPPNLGEPGQDITSELATRDAERNARAREAIKERRETQQHRGDVIRATINSPHQVEVRGNQVAINIRPEPQKQDQNKLPPVPDTSKSWAWGFTPAGGYAWIEIKPCPA